VSIELERLLVVLGKRPTKVDWDEVDENAMRGADGVHRVQVEPFGIERPAPARSKS
jgi:hypothetical protein